MGLGYKNGQYHRKKGLPMSKSLSHQLPLVEAFSIFDDFSRLLVIGKKIGRPRNLSLAEVATISLIKAEYQIKTWKGLYKLLRDKFSQEFKLPAYQNFVSTMNSAARELVVLVNGLLQINKQQSGVIKLVDSTPLPVCKNKRISRHKTMKRLASRKKSTMGWFYGLKLHVVTDLKGNLLLIEFTTGSVDDRVPLDHFLEKLTNSLVVADAGYVSGKLEKKAIKNNNLLITVTRSNMKKIITYAHHLLLNLRNRVETVFSVLKTKLGLVTSLPRSEKGYLAHYIHCIFGYCCLKSFNPA